MQKQAKLTSKGQVTVPREVRRLLGVGAGDRLMFESDGKGVRVRPVRSQSAFSKYRAIGNPGTGWCAPLQRFHAGLAGVIR